MGDETQPRERAVLVTGGAGFIGTALSPHLLTRGLPVVAIDSLLEQVHPAQEWPQDLPQDVRRVRGDVTDPALWDEVLARWEPELVVVLAAETGTGQSLTESTRHAMTNVVGVSVMLDAFVRHDAMPAHLVITSSRAVYGEGAWRSGDGEVFYPGPRSHAQLETGAWDHTDRAGNPGQALPANAEHTHPSPASIYGSTKLAQENLLRNWAASFGIPVSVFRLQNVYGPGQSPHNPYTGIITLFHRLASRGEQLDVYEDGEIGRDFVYIDDVVAALAAGIQRPPEGSEPRVLDIGTGQVTTILDAARMIAQVHGAPEPQISGKFRDGDVRYAVADTDPAVEALDWKPQVSFVDGSAAVSQWLREGGFLG